MKQMSSGDRIKTIATVGWGNVAKLAEALQVKGPSLYPYANDHKEPGAKLLRRLSSLGVNAHWVTTGEGVMFAPNPAGYALARRAKLSGFIPRPDPIAARAPSVTTGQALEVAAAFLADRAAELKALPGAVAAPKKTTKVEASSAVEQKGRPRELARG